MICCIAAAVIVIVFILIVILLAGENITLSTLLSGSERKGKEDRYKDTVHNLDMQLAAGQITEETYQKLRHDAEERYRIKWYDYL